MYEIDEIEAMIVRNALGEYIRSYHRTATNVYMTKEGAKLFAKERDATLAIMQKICKFPVTLEMITEPGESNKVLEEKNESHL